MLREKIPSGNNLSKFLRSINSIAIFDISSQNKFIFGGLVYVFIRPFLVALILFIFLAIIRRGYTLVQAIELFLMPIVLYYFILSFIGSTNFLDANKEFIYFPHVINHSILFGKILSNLIIHFFVVSIALLIIFYFEIQLSLVSVIALFILSFIFGSSYFLLFSTFLSGKKQLKEIHSFIPRFLLFVSCIIFPLDIFSEEIQMVLLYNPIVHIAELSRLSFSKNILSQDIGQLSLGYVIFVTASLFLMAIVSNILKFKIFPKNQINE